jgi:D-alanyl-D-alanine carboxypeptidase/D-alanyl-D-alanine-endopeptidase (penicillin-binding protein 4)
VLLIMVVLVVSVGLYFAVGQTRQYLADRSFHPVAIPAPSPPTGEIAAALTGLAAVPGSSAPTSTAPAPTAPGIARLLGPLLTDASLGPSVSAQVYDAATSSQLLSQRASEPVAPASTAKLLTAAALLNARKGTDRFTTTVVAGTDPGTVVLVGGGDPTLSAAPAGEPAEYDEAARISDLAAQVKRNLAGASVQRVIVDGSLFSGPATAPGWAAEDAPSSYASPITAAMVDGGRDAPGDLLRSGSPDLAAGQALARALGGAAVERGTAAPGTKLLGSVRSAPVQRLVEQMLSESDNVIAEVLTRQVAIALHKPASFAGGAGAVATSVSRLGITLGTGMKDGSGLSAADRLPAGTLGQVLLAAAGPKDPQLRPIIAALSVAGWDGTLVEQGRFTGSSAGGDGTVRAKTGSLTGVTAIAGVLSDKDGRQLVFAFVADKVPGGDPNSTAARTVLDSAVSGLVTCGCR